jgi:Flp pilus assembly pilin Flp
MINQVILRFPEACWREDDGVLTFEWTLLLTLLVIGVISGLTGARDAVIDELGDVAHAAVSFDQSYSVEGVPCVGLPGCEFHDPNDAIASDDGCRSDH